MADSILTAENLSISFGGVNALVDVNVAIARGEIRCLVGENGSGKSTFVKIASGVYHPSRGTVQVGGKLLSPGDPRAAIDAGIQVVFQDLALFDQLSVAENIAFSVLLNSKNAYVGRKRMRQLAADVLEIMEVELPLDDPVSTLSMANKQLVAIARALCMDAQLIFMDEPTAALTKKEVNRLLEVVLGLRDRGISIVFISHKLDEVFRIADTITIFRDGRKVGDFEAAELTQAKLTYYMTGREVEYPAYKREPREADEVPLLEVRGLADRLHYRDVSFSVRPGDVLGLTGLLGAGRTEVALTLFGLNQAVRGEILLDGKPARIASPQQAVASGIALVSEDRKTEGLFMEQSVGHNISSTRLDTLLNKLRFLDLRAERELASRMVQAMGVNNKDIDILVGKLSGGNAQKVVIGKWIATEPRLLILDSPTVGIDVGSKAEIYESIQRLARAGMGIILISDEPEEIAANCNRVIVMYEGAIVATVSQAERETPDFVERLARMISEPTSQLAAPIQEGVPQA
ncbi:MAG: sugar ABC transporter ATP-binding protein [Propionibacteriaceae bacterium]|jgi:simple sugar transport system ATP-binding protein|nr:sugar ABC transporter ATP-binding protein [Propionibacteriaceae bacterium]